MRKSFSNMRLNKRIPAFTLMEVTIAMLVAGVAIAITFTAFRIVNGSYTGFSKKQAELADFVRLDKLLKQDFIAAQSVLKSSDGLVIEMENGLIRYTIDPVSIVRDQFSLRTDTFKLAVSNAEFSFEKNDVQDETLLDQFEFETVMQGQSVSLHYHKIYSAQDLFK